MTIARVSASPVYFGHVLPSTSTVPVRRLASPNGTPSVKAGKPAVTDRLLEWVVPLLTLIGTAAAMWFVVTDGWFQLFGFWAS